jgi:hypothetical protein
MKLDRASAAYARGFRDCRDNRFKLSFDDRTFYGHDYNEGWASCWNEQYWDATRENERRGLKPIRTTRNLLNPDA